MERANPFKAAIDELEKELTELDRQFAELERNRNALTSAVNLLRGKSGMPPRPSGQSGESHDRAGDESPISMNIQHDTFFGKKMSSSVREFLDMRKAARLGPAKPREIFEALKQGGYQWEAKDDEIAQSSLRGMLSKYTAMFQKLPNGSYGLKTWYPDARKPKAATSKEPRQEERASEHLPAANPQTEEEQLQDMMG